MEKFEGKKVSYCFETLEGNMIISGNTIDELIDGLSILKDGQIILNFIDIFNQLTKEQLERIDEIMLEAKDTKKILEYAIKREGLSNIEKFERRLIKSENFSYLIEFYKKYKGKFFEEVEESIANSKDSQLIFEFSELEGANLIKLKDAILKSNDIDWIICFFITYQKKKVITSQEDIEKFEEIIITEQCASDIFWFAETVNSANIEKLEDAIVKTGNKHYIFRFAKEIKGANIEKLRKAIIRIGDKAYIYKFKLEIGSGNKFIDFIFKYGTSK